MLRLTFERLQKKWTKTELGFKSNIHPSVVGKLEDGKIYPYETYKTRLSKVFNIPGDELFKEVDGND